MSTNTTLWHHVPTCKATNGKAFITNAVAPTSLVFTQLIGRPFGQR